MAIRITSASTCRSARNEAYLVEHGKVSRIHNKKLKGKPMSEAVRCSNAQKSKVRVYVEHVFAELKSRMGLFVRTIGIKEQRLPSPWPTWLAT